MSTPSVRQWMRTAQVVVGANGSGISITDLRIEFQVIKTIEKTPNSGVIKIYNLSPDNQSKLGSEFNEVILNVGYEGATQILFRGNIKRVFRYRAKNDYITQLEVGDGDDDFRRATMNHTLVAGTTDGDLVTQAVGSFSSTTRGFIGIPSAPRIRGVVLTGNTRDILSDLARDAGANWSIQDGQLTIVNTTAVLPGTAVVVNTNTGMIGTPEINDKGIAVKCLLNPLLKVNGAIQLDNNNIMLKLRRQRSLPHTGAVGNVHKKRSHEPVKLNPDGIYKIIRLEQKGDTRGPDWVSDILCLSPNQPIAAVSTPEEEEAGDGAEYN